MSPHNTKAQIDYIITRKKWHNSIMNAEAYNTFSNVGSDHRVVTTRIRLSLRAPKVAKEKVIRYNWRELESCPQLQTKYAVKIKNRFEALECDSDNITEKYDHFVEANKRAAETCLNPLPRTRKTNRSSDVRIQKAREEVETAYRDHVKICNETSKEVYEGKKQKLYSTYQQVEEEELDEQIKQVEGAHASQQHNKSWKLINTISGRKTAQASKIKEESEAYTGLAWAL